MDQEIDSKTVDQLMTSVSVAFDWGGVGMAVKFGNSKSVFPYKTVQAPINLDNKSGLSRGILPWGTSNKLPEEIVKKIEESEILGKALEFLIDTAYGSGIVPGKFVKNAEGKNEFEEMPISELIGDEKEFFELSNPNQYLKSALTNLFYFNRAYAEIVMDKGAAKKRKAVLLTCKDTTFVRVEAPDTDGEIERIAYYGSWGWKTPSDEELAVMPLLDLDLPKRDFLVRTGELNNADGKTEDDKSERYIYPLSIMKPMRREYPQPAWWSVFKSGWYDFMMAIPQFKKSLMKNQMMVKYVIYLEKDYFVNLFKEEKITGEKEKKERMTKEFENWKKFLTDTENTGKSVIGKHWYNPMNNGKEEKNIMFEVLPNNFKGGEYLEDSQEVSKLIGTSMGLNLNMIGDIPGKTGTLSGTDVRERFIMLNAQMAGIRHLALEPLYAIKRRNKWRSELEFSIPNVELTTLDKGTGAQKVVGGPKV